MAGLEEQLEILLKTRALNGRSSQQQQQQQQEKLDQIYGVDLRIVGLLFAVMASGSQSSNLTAKERELMSQVYSMFCNQEKSSAGPKLTMSSLLRISMSSNDQFCLCSDLGSDSDHGHHLQRARIQHESRHLIYHARYVVPWQRKIDILIAHFVRNGHPYGYFYWPSG